MGIVRTLSPHVANCIAAGEVVKNPASVVKELCENSIDAHATEICVSIRGGGIRELIVEDNGCGMGADDAVLCFSRHATSKLRSEEDLAAIGTLGFRGEALAAISAVARVTLETAQEGAECGTRIVRAYGENIEQGDAVRAPGTTFTVEELFRNTPARMKFLRSDAAEGAAVAAAVGRLALSHPEVRFVMRRDTRTVFETSGSGDLYQAVTDFCGREFARGLLRIDPEQGDAEKPVIWGYVTAPNAARATRTMQYVFLNGRAVQSKTVTAALDDACHGFMTTGRFPGCVLHIALDPELCDINVHPEKLTVKFVRESDVYTAVRRAVRGAYENERGRPLFTLAGLSATVPPEEECRREREHPVSDMQKSPAAPPSHETLAAQTYAHDAGKAAAAPEAAPSDADKAAGMPYAHDAEKTAGTLPDTFAEETAPRRVQVVMHPAAVRPAPVQDAPVQDTPYEDIPGTECPPPPDDADAPPGTGLVREDDFRVLGIVFETYMVVEHADEVLFIDFHATHERIRYDRLLREYHEGGVDAQTLLASVILPAEPEEYAAILANARLLARCGVETEPFGEHEIAVRALPACIEPEDAGTLIASLTRELRTPGTSAPEEELLHLIACHGARRSGDALSESERRTLAQRVIADPGLRNCPHGRPVAMRMTKRDFTRNFGR